MKAGDFCDLAAELVSEHGASVVSIAQRASAEYACEGADDRAFFWYALSLFVDDIVSCRLDPLRPLTVH